MSKIFYYTAREVAERLGVSLRQVQQLVADGKLTRLKSMNRIVIAATELAAYQERLRERE